jgi:hypothetical protein
LVESPSAARSSGPSEATGVRKSCRVSIGNEARSISEAFLPPIRARQNAERCFFFSPSLTLIPLGNYTAKVICKSACFGGLQWQSWDMRG